VLAHLSICFAIDAATGGMAGLKPLDAILVMAVNQANIAPLTRDPEARLRYGALAAPAPDEDRRPVSVSAVASSLALPYETVRRRLRHLADAGVCALSERGAVVPQAFLISPAYLESARALHERMWTFYREALAAGLVGDLPASRYPVDAGVAVRGAIRLGSDYLLRVAETFVAHFGDMLSALVGMAVLCASLGPDGQATDAPVTVTALAQRLQIPIETVRRHAVDLVGRGRLLRVRRGLAIPEELLAGPDLAVRFHDNAAHVHRLFAGLAERGVVDAWERLRPAGPEASPVARGA
jgi:DNA-binding IscR family transcriptional regulator